MNLFKRFEKLGSIYIRIHTKEEFDDVSNFLLGLGLKWSDNDRWNYWERHPNAVIGTSLKVKILVALGGRELGTMSIQEFYKALNVNPPKPKYATPCLEID